jgi:hypothetical protein
MKVADVRVNRFARCSFCGAPFKAIDVNVERNRITHDCRSCHARLIEVELAPARIETPWWHEEIQR